MNLITAEDEASILAILDDLWDTDGQPLMIIKSPQVTMTSIGGSFVPGFGQTSNPNNFTPTPESKTFVSLTFEKYPDGQSNAITDKREPKQNFFLKVKKDARDYILDGRPNLYASYLGRKYNILSDEQIVHIASRVYYIFQFQLAT